MRFLTREMPLIMVVREAHENVFIIRRAKRGKRKYRRQVRHEVARERDSAVILMMICVR